MLFVKKSHLKRAGWIALIVLLVGGVLVGVTLAEGENAVTIKTTPIKTDQELYIDLDENGVDTPNELVGVFDVYDGNEELTFWWLPYAFAEGENGAYAVSLWQNTTPLEAVPTWNEIKLNYHLANDPQPTQYTFGAFGFGEDVCTNCPTMIVVRPATYVKEKDAKTGVYEYVFTLVGGAASDVAEQADGLMQTSELFTIEIFRPVEGDCPHPWSNEAVCIAFECRPNDQACMKACKKAVEQSASIKDDVIKGDYYWSADKEKCVCGLGSKICAEQGGKFSKQFCVCILYDEN
jgi:hypothetical protein